MNSVWVPVKLESEGMVGKDGEKEEERQSEVTLPEVSKT